MRTDETAPEARIFAKPLRLAFLCLVFTDARPKRTMPHCEKIELGSGVEKCWAAELSGRADSTEMAFVLQPTLYLYLPPLQLSKTVSRR